MVNVNCSLLECNYVCILMGDSNSFIKLHTWILTHRHTIGIRKGISYLSVFQYIVILYVNSEAWYIGNLVLNIGCHWNKFNFLSYKPHMVKPSSNMVCIYLDYRWHFRFNKNPEVLIGSMLIIIFVIHEW